MRLLIHIAHFHKARSHMGSSTEGFRLTDIEIFSYCHIEDRPSASSTRSALHSSFFPSSFSNTASASLLLSTCLLFFFEHLPFPGSLSASPLAHVPRGVFQEHFAYCLFQSFATIIASLKVAHYGRCPRLLSNVEAVSCIHAFPSLSSTIIFCSLFLIGCKLFWMVKLILTCCRRRSSRAIWACADN